MASWCGVVVPWAHILEAGEYSPRTTWEVPWVPEVVFSSYMKIQTSFLCFGGNRV